MMTAEPPQDTRLVRIELLLDNRLVGRHTYRLGDVVEMPLPRAKDWVKKGHGQIVMKPVTPIPAVGPARSQLLRQREQSATDPAPSGARRAVARPRPADQA